MIGYLKGQLLSKKPNLILLDVQGVGYEVHIPLTSFYDLPGEGSQVALKIHTHVREDALILYRLCSQREKDFFLKHVSISGSGRKVAIGISSEPGPERRAPASAKGHLARQSTIREV